MRVRVPKDIYRKGGYRGMQLIVEAGVYEVYRFMGPTRLLIHCNNEALKQRLLTIVSLSEVEFLEEGIFAGERV